MSNRDSSCVKMMHTYIHIQLHIYIYWIAKATDQLPQQRAGLIDFRPMDCAPWAAVSPENPVQDESVTTAVK